MVQYWGQFGYKSFVHQTHPLMNCSGKLEGVARLESPTYLVRGTKFGRFTNWPLPGTSRVKPKSWNTEQTLKGGLVSATCTQKHAGAQTLRHISALSFLTTRN